ncbi:MAG: serpin family protein [Bacteroidales bacterium]|nr:serpin family protein [Bacteroidales bacterium]
MKNYISYVVVILISVSAFPSCEESGPIQKETPKITLNKKAAEIIEADKAFGFELFREVYILSEEDNIMISPLSVSYALGMTYNGAAGTTLEAFNDVLHFGDLTTEEVNESYKDLMDQLLNLDDKVDFSIANSIWYRLGFQVLPEFINTNKDYFDAAVKEIDFSDPQTVEVINQWIEDKTNGKIKDMLDFIPGNAVMYLINAIYFNATWKYEFEKEDTYQGDFNLADGTKHQADYMRVSGNFVYTSNEDFTAVELPYGDSTFSMVVMLPSPENEVSDLVVKMDVAHWDSWFDNSSFTGVQIDLPKFKYEFKELLNEPLTDLGLGVAFSEFEADFTRINPAGNLFISRVIHQTFIDVQEEGTEAAAATIVEISLTSSGGGGSPIYFKADKPFLYLIKENSTGAIVFIGKVGKPEYP